MASGKQIVSEINLKELRGKFDIARDTGSVRESANARDQLISIVPKVPVKSIECFNLLNEILRSNDPELSLAVRKNSEYSSFEKSTVGKVSILSCALVEFASNNPEFFDGIHTAFINLREQILTKSNSVPLIYVLPARRSDSRQMIKELTAIIKKNEFSANQALPIISHAVEKMTSMFGA